MAEQIVENWTEEKKEAFKKIIEARNAVLKAKKDFQEVLKNKPSIDFWMFETDVWSLEETLQGIDENIKYVVLGSKN